MTLPSNSLSSNGLGVITGDQLNTLVQWCNTASTLRSFVGEAGVTVALQGIIAPNDGLGGMFYWVVGSFTDDGLTIIVPPAAAGQGAWIKIAGFGGGGGGDFAFNPNDFTVVGDVVSLAATIVSTHTWSLLQTFSVGITSSGTTTINGTLTMTGLPTDPTGLAVGTVWNNSGSLDIII